MLNWKGYLTVFVVGVAGVAVGLLIWHLWIDHRTLHAIVDLINQNAAQAAKGAAK